MNAARRLALSLSLRFPALRTAADGAWRYDLLFRLGRPHDSDFAAFAGWSSDRPRHYLDVGANSGMSVLSIMAVDPGARVTSFEPNRLHFERLDELAGRFDRFRWEAYGLSDREATETLWWPEYRGVPMTGLASFDRDAAAGWLGERDLWWVDPGALVLRSADFQLRRLDDLDLAADAVKIDVQGLEPRVVAGGRDTLARHRPVLLVEDVDHGSELHGELTELGYRPFVRHRGRLVEGRLDRENVFFAHRDRLRSGRPAEPRAIGELVR